MEEAGDWEGKEKKEQGEDENKLLRRRGSALDGGESRMGGRNCSNSVSVLSHHASRRVRPEWNKWAASE